MPDVLLRRQSDSELRFAHPFLGGWIFAGIGCAIVYFGIRHADAAMARWMSVAMGTLFAAIGVGGALWRYELTLDLVARSYRGRRGLWLSARSLQGSLSELRGVVLTRSWRRGNDSSHAVWVVSLEFQGWEKPVSIFETTSERKGYRRLEELAKRLQTTAIDRTGDRQVERTLEQLDRSVAQLETDSAVESVHGIEDPPPGSGIEWTRTEIGEPEIALPALGFNFGAVFLMLFALPFLVFGSVALASAVGWNGIEVHGSLSAKWIVGGVFVALGIVLWAGAIFGTVAHEVVREDGDALVVTLRAFGRHYRRRRLPRREIEEISIKPCESSVSRAGSKTGKTEVVLRSDDRVVRMAGELQPDGQQWLRRALLALARR